MIFVAGDFIEPSKGKLNSFILKGADLTQYVHCVRTYESICKPYLTAQVIIYDTNNLIENLQIVAEDPGSCDFHAPPNDKHYTWNLNVLKMKGEQVPDTLKYQIYYIDLIGEVYYQDRHTTIQMTHQDMPGTGEIQRIWGQFLSANTLDPLQQSAGMYGTDDQASSSANISPLTAIYDIMKKLTSSSTDTGNWMLFRDNTDVKLGQLEPILQNALSTATEQYYQKETWGITVGQQADRLLYHAIIVAQAEAGRGDGGRGSGADIAAATQQSQTVMDLATGTLLNNSGINASGVAGGMQLTDASRWANATAPFTKTLKERNFSAQVRNGPQLTLKVPLQTGLNATVGQGIYAELCPPTGDLSSFNINTFALYGNWLVTDIVHELYTDERESQATTSMQTVKGPV